jgi:hypothetical protein
MKTVLLCRRTRRARSTTGKYSAARSTFEVWWLMLFTTVTGEYLWPYKEDVMRFDFEVDEEDEYMCQWVTKAHLCGMASQPGKETSRAAPNGTGSVDEH